jgi:hypothetical protein
MPRRTVQPIPPMLDAQWPLLRVTPADINPPVVIRRPPTPAQKVVRMVRRNSRRTLISAGKGIVLAVLVAAAMFGIAPMQDWWLSGWHWAGGLLLFAGCWLLFGLDAGVLILTVVGLIQLAFNLPGHTNDLVTLGAAVIAARVLWEWTLIARHR